MAEWKFHKKRAFGLLVALSTVVVGVIGYLYFKKPVDVVALDKAIAKADRLVILGDPFQGRQMLYESTDREEIELLGRALKVEQPEMSFACACAGTESMNFYRAEKLLARVSNHHGVFIRCTLWSSDAALTNPELMVRWFEERGMFGPRREVNENARSDEERSKNWVRWLAAVPKGLENIWDRDQDIVGRAKTLAPLQAALEQTFPSAQERVLALCAWYGSGAGPWSGYPGYETIGEELLLTYSTGELVEAMQSAGMATPAHWEGAARLLGGWTFSKERPGDLALVPANLKKAMWDHVKDTKDQDKLGRAQLAFLPKDASKK
ncbi:hypothetical protein DES53_102332 [Roseimicrobium gellanilyticum]|uniref:Uncharacterized protein n=1 Tax=Roseimicrobium gellanilyticum TaxID=748857 RepID=A0A366HS74_9BACT|nr:hypothetical protein [Roseimicrobium gellanilyticum]RBP45948.1 hypothetical protein DES53_102332 [Roseimicrobium gellanilyticum]